MKKVLLAAAVIVTIAALIWFLNPKQNPPLSTSNQDKPTTVGESVTDSESTAQLNEEIQALDVSNLNTDFQDVDADLNQL